MRAPWDGCSERPKGAGRVPWGPEHPPTCSSSLCLPTQVADAPCKCQRYRLRQFLFLVGKGCATHASALGRMQRTAKGCWSGPWGPEHPPTCSSSLCLVAQVADAPCKCQRHRLRKGQFLLAKGCATRASPLGQMQRTTKGCWSGPCGSRSFADMQQQPLPCGAGG